jgi:hypothetical protein
MAYQLFRLPKSTNIGTASFRLEAGAKAYFYATGTTTPQNTYSDSGLLFAHPNPVVADSAGVLPAIYLDPSLAYKLTLKTSADVLIYTVDPANDRSIDQDSIGRILYPQTDAELAASVTPSNYAYPPGNILRYGAVGNDSTDCTAAIQSAINLSAASGTACFIPEGTFRITSSLTMRYAMTLIGESEYLSTIKAVAAIPLFIDDHTIDDMARTSFSKVRLYGGTYAHLYTRTAGQVQSIGEWTRVRFENQTVRAIDCNQYFLLNSFIACSFWYCTAAVRCGVNANLNTFTNCQFGGLSRDIIRLETDGIGRGGEVNYFTGCRFEARGVPATDTGYSAVVLASCVNTVFQSCYFEDTFKVILTETGGSTYDTTTFRDCKFSGQEVAVAPAGAKSELFNSDGVVTFENCFFEVGSNSASTCSAHMLGRNRGLNTTAMRIYLNGLTPESGKAISKPWTPVTGVAVNVVKFSRTETTAGVDTLQGVFGNLRVSVVGADGGGSPFFINSDIPFVVKGFSNGVMAVTTGTPIVAQDNGPGATITTTTTGALAGEVTLCVTVTKAGLLSVRARAEIEWRIAFGTAVTQPTVTILM